MDEENHNDLGRKKLCFNCKDSWDHGHMSMGNGKGHYIEVLSESEDENEAEQEKDCKHEKSYEEQPQEESKSGATMPLYRMSPDFTPSRSGMLYKVNKSSY
jgi:hypothetical protein